MLVVAVRTGARLAPATAADNGDDSERAAAAAAAAAASEQSAAGLSLAAFHHDGYGRVCAVPYAPPAQQRPSMRAERAAISGRLDAEEAHGHGAAGAASVDSAVDSVDSVDSLRFAHVTNWPVTKMTTRALAFAHLVHEGPGGPEGVCASLVCVWRVEAKATLG